MSFFTRAAKPAVKLEQRARRLRDYLNSRFWMSGETLDRCDVLTEMIEMLERGKFDDGEIAVCARVLDELEHEYPGLQTYRKRSALNEATFFYALAGAFYVCAAALYWVKRETYVLEIPVTLVDAANLPISIKSANAA